MRHIVLLLSIALPAVAAELTVLNAWVREAPPGAAVLAGYLTLSNPGPTDQALIKARSPQFEAVELHQTVHQQGIARMLPQAQITLTPGATLKMEPGGYHLMLIHPKVLLKAGATVSLVLEFSDGTSQEVKASVKKEINAPTDHHPDHH